MEKRYQFRTKDGIEWTSWFNWNSEDCPQWQLKSYGLRNEYRD